MWRRVDPIRSRRDRQTWARDSVSGLSESVPSPEPGRGTLEASQVTTRNLEGTHARPAPGRGGLSKESGRVRIAAVRRRGGMALAGTVAGLLLAVSILASLSKEPVRRDGSRVRVDPAALQCAFDDDRDGDRADALGAFPPKGDKASPS
jgi:hypothetical protein